MKWLRIKLSRERNDLFFANLVSSRLEPFPGFKIFEIMLFHREPATIHQRFSGPSKEKYCALLDSSPFTYQIFERAVSSVVERLVYTERVGGSKPSPPISEVGSHRSDVSGLRATPART